MKILDDSADKIDKSIYFIKILDIKFGSILVHCGAGVSRVL